MSALYRNFLFAPIDSMMFFELGCTGQSSTTRFHALSGGNTSRADTMAPASGVSNRIGLSILGILAERMRSTRAGSPWTGVGATGIGAAGLTTNGVMVRSISLLPPLPVIL